MSIDLLSSNFKAMYHSVCNEGSLIAKGDSLYRGDAWAWGASKSDEKIREAVQKTAQLFQEILQNSFNPNLETYQESLSNRCLNLPVDEHKVHSARSFLQLWEQSTYPFLSLMQQPQDKAKQFLNNYFPQNPFLISQWEDFQSCRAIIELEGMSGDSLPIRDFMVLSHSMQEPSDDFKTWANRFKVMSANEDEGIIHRGLFACIHQITKEFPRKKHYFSAVRLQLAIWNLGYKDILTHPDKEQMAWRNALQVGDRLDSYTLANRMGGKLHDFDRQFVFEVADRDDVVLVVPQNRSIIGMRKFAMEQRPKCGVVPYQFVDEEGRYGEVEKLLDPLDGYKWEGTSDLSEQDKERLSVRIELVKMFLSMQTTPKIDLTKFRRTRQCQICCIDSFSSGGFNFNHIETDLIYKTSQGSPAVYAYLVQKTGISHHPYFAFYTRVVKNSAENLFADIAYFGGMYKIEDASIIDRAKELYQQVAKLREAVCSAALSRNVRLPKDQLAKLIVNAIHEQYIASFGVGRILPHVETAVITFVINSTKQ